MTAFPTHVKNHTPCTQVSTVGTTALGINPGRQEKRQNALVMLSGGQDSSLVTWILFHAQHYYFHQPQSLHYQHFLQSGALYAQTHCSQLSFWFNWTSLSYSATRSYTSEKDAGDWRSASSVRLASYYTCPFLFKGQSLTDQYETTATLLLRTIANRSEKKDDLLLDAEDSPVGPHSILFVRSKKLSYWVPMTIEKKDEGRVKLYRGIKYGT